MVGALSEYFYDWMPRCMAEAPSIPRIESAEVRVKGWRLSPGVVTGFQRHDHDYVVVPLRHGTLCLATPAGESTLALSSGAAYFRKAGVEHKVFIADSEPLAFIDIELKDHPG